MNLVYMSGGVRVDFVMSHPISLKLRRKLKLPKGWRLRLYGVTKCRMTLAGRLNSGADFSMLTPAWLEEFALKLTLMEEKNSAT